MSIFSYHLFLATTKNRPKLPPQLLIENHLHTTIAICWLLPTVTCHYWRKRWGRRQRLVYVNSFYLLWMIAICWLLPTVTCHYWRKRWGRRQRLVYVNSLNTLNDSYLLTPTNSNMSLLKETLGPQTKTGIRQ